MERTLTHLTGNGGSMTSSLWRGCVPEFYVVPMHNRCLRSHVLLRSRNGKKRLPIGMHGGDFDALEQKRRVDDVIIMAWVGARILCGSNALYMFRIACVAEEQERKNRFPIGLHGEHFDAPDRKRRVDGHHYGVVGCPNFMRFQRTIDVCDHMCC